MLDIFNESRSEANIAATLAEFGKLAIDSIWSSRVVDLVKTVADIRAILHYLAGATKPAVYLEIGVRRGFSMAMVASAASDCDLYGFDVWVPNYAGVENPGPEFVAAELSKFNHCGRVEFINGRSIDTLPVFFKARDIRPDLILVDGDHTPEGALADLALCLHQLADGGYLMFDDLIGPLVNVWEDTKRSCSDDFTFDESDLVGVAYRGTGRK